MLTGYRVDRTSDAFQRRPTTTLYSDVLKRCGVSVWPMDECVW